MQITIATSLCRAADMVFRNGFARRGALPEDLLV